MKHTPGKWQVTSGMVETVEGIPIAEMDREPGNGTLPVERDANAHHIVKCVNSHLYLLEACKAMAEYLSQQWEADWENRPNHLRLGEEAIAAATGGE